MSKQPSTVQTSSNSVQNVDPWITAAQQGYNQSAYGTYSPFYNSAPNYRVAGLNQDQTAAYDLYRQVGQDAFGTAPISPNTSGYTPTGGGLASEVAPQTAGWATEVAPQTAGWAAETTAAQLAPGAISEFMNPFTQAVIDPTVANMRRQHDNTAAQIGAQGAAAGSFGGSREALRLAQNDRALGEQVAQTVPALQSQGWQQAAQLASQNTQMQQQAALANTSARNNMAQYNAGAMNSVGLANASARNNMQQYNTGALNNAAQYNAGAINDMKRYNSGVTNQAEQFNRNLGLQGAQAQDSLRTSEQARRLAAIAQILGAGNAQQNQLQNILNIPTGSLGAYGQTIPQQYNSTTNTVGTQPNTAPGLGQQLLGGGLSLLGLKTAGGGSVGASLLGGLGLLCDARLKKDIVSLGKDRIGRQLFAYRYKWQEGDDEPYTIGPMAQLEEQRDPNSVIEVFGVKLVKVY